MNIRWPISGSHSPSFVSWLSHENRLTWKHLYLYLQYISFQQQNELNEKITEAEQNSALNSIEESEEKTQVTALTKLFSIASEDFLGHDISG